jgi:hypothetical protein
MTHFVRSILKDSTGLGQLTGNDPLPPAAEKCVRQVIYKKPIFTPLRYCMKGKRFQYLCQGSTSACSSPETMAECSAFQHLL